MAQERYQESGIGSVAQLEQTESDFEASWNQIVQMAEEQYAELLSEFEDEENEELREIAMQHIEEFSEVVEHIASIKPFPDAAQLDEIQAQLEEVMNQLEISITDNVNLTELNNIKNRWENVLSELQEYHA